MYDDLKIAYYQREIVFGDKQKNYEAIEQEMANHKDEGVNLLVLPVSPSARVGEIPQRSALLSTATIATSVPATIC